MDVKPHVFGLSSWGEGGAEWGERGDGGSIEELMVGQYLTHTVGKLYHGNSYTWQDKASLIVNLLDRQLLSTLAGIACWLEHRTRDRKVASSNTGRSGGRIFFSRVNFVC